MRNLLVILVEGFIAEGSITEHLLGKHALRILLSLHIVHHLVISLLEVADHFLLGFVIGLQTLDLVQEHFSFLFQVVVLVLELLHFELHILE